MTGTMTSNACGPTDGDWRVRLRERYTIDRALLSLVPVVAGIHARSALAAFSRRGYVGLQELIYGATEAGSDPGFIKIDYSENSSSL